MTRYRTRRLYIKCGGMRRRIGHVWIPDGLHVWWKDRGVHLYWSDSPHIKFDRDRRTPPRFHKADIEAWIEERRYDQ